MELTLSCSGSTKVNPGSISYLLFLARSVVQQAKEEGAGLLLGGVGAVDGVNSFLIRFYKNEPRKYLTTCCSSPDLSRSKPKNSALVFLIRIHKNEPRKFLTTCCSSLDLSRSKPKNSALVFFLVAWSW
jgi:hypothetical protein